MSASLDTLFLPLESGAITPSGRTLFIGAQAHGHLSTLKPDIWQPFKPLMAGLSGLPKIETLPETPVYDGVIVQIPKQVEEARYWIACALYALKPDGWLALAAANDANGNRLEKWLKELGLPSESLTKNKARVVWTKRPATIPLLLEEWRVQGGKQKVQIGDGNEFISQPGLFGWDKIDAGSKLLTHYIPKNLKGTGGDFGAGTGYLSRHVLERCPDISALYLAEADSRALDCARENLENVRGLKTVEYVWADLAKPAALPALDFIVMNPPFHTGKKTEAGLGQAFIETAAHHLKKGGKLYMVANAHLPYEKILREKFTSTNLLAEKNGFKIFEAQK